MYNLSFISDENLYEHTKDTILKYRFDINLKEFNKNIIDPVKFTFDYKIYHKDIKEAIDFEVIRQLDKSNANHIGYFHQNIFKYISSEWIIPKEGFDLINEKKKIYVELKNKHNTMNSSSAQKTYIAMQNQILKGSDITCMLVEVIAKKSQNIPWKITINKEQFSHDNIRRVSIDNFYKIVTGQDDSFKKLTEVLPKVIDDVLKQESHNIITNSVYDELKHIDPNILKSIYKLAFSSYIGFDSLNI